MNPATLAIRSFHRGIFFESIRVKWVWHYRATRMAVRLGLLSLILAPHLAYTAPLDESRLLAAIRVE